MLLVIVAAILAYRKANDNGRNGILWALIAAGVFIGTQIIVALVLGIVLGIFYAATNRADTDFSGADILITIVAVIFSFGSTWAVLKYLEKPPRQEVLTNPPPPPENFN